MLKLKLLVVLVFAAAAAAPMFVENPAHAFSSGPPAGFTRAPGELDCSECHLFDDSGTGSIVVEAPQFYSPGQTYDITVRHINSDPTRVRWGFQLTALDASDERAGAFAPSDTFTQVLDNQGPFPTRQYIEHTQAGTFPGQQGGATWTFKWTAPSEDVGIVSFYAAGNHANGDANSSGDHIYFTFGISSFKPPEPDFDLQITPTTRSIAQGASTTFDVTVTPRDGFTGAVTLSLAGLPPDTTADFQPPTLNVTGAAAQTSTLTFNTSASVPQGAHPFKVTAASGSLSHTASATLHVLGPGDADLSVTLAVSPNPAQVGAELRGTVNVTNNGPGAAGSPALVVSLSPTFALFTEGLGGNLCSLSPGMSVVLYGCSLPSLAAGQTMTFDFTLRPTSTDVLNVRALVSDTDQHDPNPANDEVAAAVPVVEQSAGPRMTVPNLGVRTVVGGLDQPTGMAFIGPDDFIILEKATGRVLRFTDGQPRGAVLDLNVNSASERGLLGVALHPNFSSNGFVYLFWTESSTGADTTAVDEVQLLGNRVDRFYWDGSALSFDRTLIRLRALQTDAGQPARGNHNGGVLRFGPDGKLYVLFGDNGRRGLLQNITSGGPVPDDQFGGPQPDDAHLTGVILRLNDDGSTPTDNPFFNADAGLPGEAALNVRKVFAYGVRNGFGMSFDPVSGSLWTQENGDDAFDEINRVGPGFNGGWIQLMGPSSRVAEFKQIETTRFNQNLQQLRWPPSLIADTPAEALARLYNLPGSHYTEPEFSWKYAVAPSPIGFAAGNALGAPYANDLFVGASRTTLLGGYLMRFDLSGDRQSLVPSDTRLADKVADNTDKFDLTESESLLVGRDFGITTDIQTDPGGNLYVVSLSNGAVYEVFARPTVFVAELFGFREAPANSSQATGVATILLDKDETTAHVSLRFRGLTTPQTAAHIHAPAAFDQTAPPVFDLPAGNFRDFQITLTPQQVSQLKAGLFYINVHSAAFPAGEIRGQFGIPEGASSVTDFDIADANVNEGAGRKTVSVVRLGNTSEPAAIEYQTSDGTASERSDYTTARGRLDFAPGETEKSFDLFITDDGLQEPDESFHVLLGSAPRGNAIAHRPAASLTIKDNDPPFAPNPIDGTRFFVRQHYLDFLNREPDQPGWDFWTHQIDILCNGNAACVAAQRSNVSAAFFFSTEFHVTGLFVYRAHKAAYGNVPGTPVPVRYDDFIEGSQRIGRGAAVGVGDWQARLAQNRTEYALDFVRSPDFVARHPLSLTPQQFVDALDANAGQVLTPDERAQLVNALTANNNDRGRAEVLVQFALNQRLLEREFNRAFVLAQYFGYLRRDPDDAPDFIFAGYNHWLSKLDQFNGDWRRAQMVTAFLTSFEYRGRFGQ